ncbi:glycosyltransferase family 2 protein [Flavobacterium saccharophilum]|uniref:Glycosyltransferase 2-like domain-containing protein n=1 Tax=Flavobacterium saccharophilum TaxID=29534 RepID=A0A1M7K846_9FLAO|nr:glycosyltransferase family A protein [Flavobacterium saccharophilum]SHM61163.1 hypothetical protein SAMN05444366_3679 [Flavobacterium saccharophilum]
MIVKSPKVSVVIPCYNDKNYIKETIQSIVRQTYQNFEIIIVDDGSDNATKQILQTLINDRTKVITQTNRGPSAARNKGFNEADGDYILTIDADDTAEENFLEKAVAILNENTDVGAVSSYCKVFIKNHEVTSEHKPNGGTLKDFLFDNNSVSFALIRKETWQDAGGYDEAMINGFEDWEFWISTTKKGWKVEMIPELLFNYRMKDKNSVDQNAKLNYRESNLNYIYKKHQDIYITHFPETVDFLTNLAQRHKRNEIKYKTSLDHKIGSIILYPLRKINAIIKRK